MTRISRIFARISRISAIAGLREVLSEPETDMARDAAIQGFEFCFELA